MNFVSGLLYNIVLTMLRCILRSGLAKCISILMSLREKDSQFIWLFKNLISGNLPEVYIFYRKIILFFSSNKSSLSELMLNK